MSAVLTRSYQVPAAGHVVLQGWWSFIEAVPEAERPPVSWAVFPADEMACEKDQQCGGGTCCAVSLWIRSIRMCTPLGREGDECHPLSHKVPFFGKRMHHTCPCVPHLACTKIDENRYKCLSFLKNTDFVFLEDELQ
ncbi:prokineticin-2 [Bombina bombina]|uniref:prokineticin-2 n=1 Tax=Bombina bombina TaxID=8345 RepID=UPI00235ABFB9|nr:prokineticin-2 [Bombina bombina]